MIHSNITKVKSVAILGIMLIMLSSSLLNDILRQVPIYFKEPTPLIKGQTLPDIREIRKFIGRGIIVNFILGISFLTAGIGCLYLKNWARKLILWIIGVSVSYHIFRILIEVYKFHTREALSYRMITILILLLLLVFMSIKKIKYLFIHSREA